MKKIGMAAALGGVFAAAMIAFTAVPAAAGASGQNTDIMRYSFGSAVPLPWTEGSAVPLPWTQGSAVPLPWTQAYAIGHRPRRLTPPVRSYGFRP